MPDPNRDLPWPPQTQDQWDRYTSSGGERAIRQSTRVVVCGVGGVGEVGSDS
jgi:tRNA A37 threonylcarbamoyladenosine dehydratase